MPVKRIGSFAARYAAARASGRVYRGVERWSRRVAGALRNRGTGMAAHGGRRTRRGRTKFARAVRRVILDTTEKCYKSMTVAQGTGASINHDTLKAFQLWSAGTTTMFPSQGLSDGERIGDEIYVTGIMIRCMFEMPQDRRNAKVKLWYVPYNSDQGAPVNQAEFQHNVSGNTFIDPIQTDRWPGIRYLGMHQLRATDQATGSEDKSFFRKFWIPIYKKVTFREDGSTIIASGLKENGAIIATAYDTYSSFQTDTVVSRGEITATMYYKCP